MPVADQARAAELLQFKILSGVGQMLLRPGRHLNAERKGVVEVKDGNYFLTKRGKEIWKGLRKDVK